MALIVADRVQETSTTTGTGAITLAGAVTGFRTFGSVMVNTDTTYYTITDQLSSANWEVGLGTWGTGGILTRTTILKSSNANAAVNFTSGALYVFMTYPADKAVYEDANNRVSGYVIDNSSIGSVTPSTGAFTTLSSTDLTQFTQRPIAPSQNSGQVSGFPVSLTASISSNTFARGMDFDPEGRVLYIASNSGVYSRSVAGNGVTTAVNNAASGSGYFGVKVHPQGNYLYATTNSQLQLFSLNATTGAVTFVSTQASPGGGLRNIAITPNGNFLYTTFTGGSVTPYTVNSSTGALTAGTTIAFSSEVLEIDPAGRFLYVVSAGGTSINVYSINQSTGALTFVSTTTATTTDIYIEPTGKYLYSTSGTDITQYSISSSTGSLTSLRTVADTLSSYLTGDSAGFFLYTAAFSDGSVRSYSLNPNTGEPVLVSSATGSGTSVARNIILNKNNRFIYVSSYVSSGTSLYSFYADTFSPSDLSSPPAIGSTTPNSGAFTTVTATATTTGSSTTGAFAYGTLGYSDQNTLASFQSAPNNYNQIVVQNTNSGTNASADLTISNNLGTASTYYANFGINSSGFSGTGSFGLVNAAYIGAAGGATASDLVLGTFNSTAAGAIHFVINGGATDAANINTSGRTFIGGSTSATALLHLAAGTATASTAPLKFTSGTNLTAVEAGAVEYDGTKWFGTTGETGSSRSVLDNAYYYYVTATSASIGTAIADLFANAAFTMQAGGIYAIEWHPYLTKTTAGTYVFTVTTTQTPVSVTAGFINAQSALTASNAVVNSTATAVALPATASMANASVAYIPVRAFITANATTGGTVTLRVTNSAGTVTLGRGSHIIVRRMPTGTTTGAFA